MPYKFIKDVPPAWKELDGAKLTLAQINVIANIYDELKPQEDKGEIDSASAVAISQFKKSYQKKGDSWVKRQKESINLNDIIPTITFLKEAKDGNEWDVVLIEVGPSQTYGSHGLRRYYPEDVLKNPKTLQLFENAPAMAYEFQGKYEDLFDHLPGDVRFEKSEGLAGNLVGYFDNVKFKEFTTNDGRKSKGILARFHIYEGAKWLKEMLIEMWKTGKQMLGFSIDAEGSEAPKSHNGNEYDWVSSINDILENTVVTRPAAGGQIIKLVASQRTNKESIMTKEQIITLLKEKAPHLLESKDIEKLTDKECEALLQEALTGANNKKLEKRLEEIEKKERMKESQANLKTKLIESKLPGDIQTELLESQKNKVLTEDQITTLIESKQIELNKLAGKSKEDRRAADLEKRIAEFEERQALRESQNLLISKLSESNLPDAIQRKIKKQFGNRVIKEPDINTIIADEQEVLAKLHESFPQSSQVSVGSEERDKLELAMFGFWEGEAQKDKDGKLVQPFISFKEAYAKITGDPMAIMASAGIILHDAYYYTPEISEAPSNFESYDYKRRKALIESVKMREALVTTDWAEILGNTLNRKMMKEFRTTEYQSWRKIVSDFTPITDFRAQRRLMMGGFGTLSTVAEQGTYLPLTSPGDTEVTYTPAKKGGLESITMEMVANDDVKSIRMIPVKLGRAAILTIYRNIFDMFLNNLEGDGSTTLASDTRGNAVGSTTALTGTGFETAVKTMRNQTVYGDTSDYIGMAYSPRYLLVPTTLEPMAKRIYASEVRIGASTLGTDTDNTEPNIWKGVAEPIVVPYWDATDTAQWWMVSDPATSPTVEVGFLNGKQEPELFVQDNPTVGSVFTADKITYKIRFIYGYNILDYRTLFLGESS